MEISIFCNICKTESEIDSLTNLNEKVKCCNDIHKYKYAQLTIVIHECDMKKFIESVFYNKYVSDDFKFINDHISSIPESANIVLIVIIDYNVLIVYSISEDFFRKAMTWAYAGDEVREEIKNTKDDIFLYKGISKFDTNNCSEVSYEVFEIDDLVSDKLETVKDMLVTTDYYFEDDGNLEIRLTTTEAPNLTHHEYAAFYDGNSLVIIIVDPHNPKSIKCSIHDTW